MAVAEPRRGGAGGKVNARLVSQERGRRVQHADVHALSPPGADPCQQRHRNPLRGEHAADDVGDRDAESEGRTVGGAGDAHEPGLALNHRVVSRLRAARPRLAEPGDRAVHETRTPRRDRVVAKPQALHRAGTEVLDQHVGLLQQRDRAPPRADGCFKSSVRLSLFRLMLRKYALSPLTNGGPHARVSSPLPGCSILMTRAPMSARSIVQYGPDRTRVKSSTVKPSSGAFSGDIQLHDGDRHHRVYRIQLTQL